MRFYPSSYGTSRSATKVREFNNCHDPKTGRFGPKDQGDCEAGAWEDPGRQRAIYGQQVDDAEALNLREEEVTKAQSFIEDNLPDDDDDPNYPAEVDSNGTQAAVKQQICGRMGPELEKLPGFDKFYDAFEDEITGAPGNKGEAGDGDYNWNHDPSDLKSQYESDYESYKEGVIEDADNEFYEQQSNEYAKDREKAIEAVAEQVVKLRELWEETQGELAYGDVSNHPKLPGLEDVERGNALDHVQFLKDHLIDPGELEKSSYGRTGVSTFSGHDWERAMERVDLDDPETRARIKDAMRQYTHAPAFDKSGDDLTDEAVATDLLHDTSRYFRDPDQAKYGDNGFDDWREGWGGEPEYDYKSFEDWYVSEHGEPEVERFRNSSKGARAASWIVHNWAQTAGDGAPHSVMMQEAANREFKLGATYTGQFVGRGADKRTVDRHLANHGPFLQSALRTMYNQTQTALQQAGIEYVTIFRGFGINAAPQPDPNVSILAPNAYPRSREPGFESVNRHGDFVDVLLQPMSSFSSDFTTAMGFTGYTNPTMLGTRVHRSKIIGTARSGYGCLNEYEYVVLGGRQPAFVVSKDNLAGDTRNGRFGSFWKAFKETQRRRAPRSPVVPGPGDRL